MSGIMWLASYPKSGNTWLRVLLTNYLQDGDQPADINRLRGGPIASARVWFDEWVGVEASALPPTVVNRLRPSVYRCLARDAGETLWIKVHDAWSVVDDGQPMFPSDVTVGVVYIVRNPLDVVPSAAHHWGESIAAAAERLCSPPTPRAEPAALTDQLPQRLGSWSDHVRSWTEESGLPVRIVRYEDLVADTAATFAGVVDFAGLDADPRRIDKAVRFSTFEELCRQEAVAGFRERSSEAPSGFFRRGEVGGWRDTLTPELVERVCDACGEVMDRLGYTVPPAGGVVSLSPA